jgi:hypothetical protein
MLVEPEGDCACSTLCCPSRRAESGDSGESIAQMNKTRKWGGPTATWGPRRPPGSSTLEGPQDLRPWKSARIRAWIVGRYGARMVEACDRPRAPTRMLREP